MIEDTSHFFITRLARDRIVDLAVDRPHLVGALVGLHGLQELVGRGGKVLDYHKTPDPLLLLSLGRCWHRPPALLENSYLDLLGDEPDDNRRRRLPLGSWPGSSGSCSGPCWLGLLFSLPPALSPVLVILRCFFCLSSLRLLLARRYRLR